MEKIFLFQFKYNHVQGMIKMHSVYKKHSIHYFSEVTWDLAQLLIHIMNTDFIFDIHFHNIMLWQYLIFKYHKIVAKIFITQYMNCEIRYVIWNIYNLYNWKYSICDILFHGFLTVTASFNILKVKSIRL